MKRLVAAACVLAACCASPAGAQTPAATLPTHCNDQQVAPATVTIACADDGFIINGLSWPDWGAGAAHASGTATINTCEPNCAAGNAVAAGDHGDGHGLSPATSLSPSTRG